MEAIDYRKVSLDDVLVSIWNQLEHGVRSANSPFHTPALATLGNIGPEVRTVVLRDVIRLTRQLICHTDWRSTKRAQLESNPRASWLFYDPGLKIQLRLRGCMRQQRDTAILRQRWEQSTSNSRKCYASPFAPGTPINEPMASPCDIEGGWRNFCVLVCVIDDMDWLYLDAGGHRRAQFEWTEHTWSGSWVAP